jgi:hypothetical protein
VVRPTEHADLAVGAGQVSDGLGWAENEIVQFGVGVNVLPGAGLIVG